MHQQLQKLAKSVDVRVYIPKNSPKSRQFSESIQEVVEFDYCHMMSMIDKICINEQKRRRAYEHEFPIRGRPSGERHCRTCEAARDHAHREASGS